MVLEAAQASASADGLKAALETAEGERDFLRRSLDAMQAELVGFSLSVVPGQACYVPVGHTGSGPDGELALDVRGGLGVLAEPGLDARR